MGTFKITYYWEGEDEWGAMTATGVIAKEGRTIAIDPSIIPNGSEIMIDNINEELFRIREDIKDCYTASGIAYDKPISNKSTQYSRINSLLVDESELITQRKNMLKRLDDLGLKDAVDAVDALEAEEKEMIELKYFCNYSFQHISLTTPNSIKRIRTITDRSLSKLFNKVHTCP